ncbi:MAG: FecR domain-containing protein, partial [Verrucomicrobiota bacterium]
MSAPENMEDLVDRYFLGSISEVELEQLDHRLQHDPALRNSFIAAARMDTHLREAALQFGDAIESEDPPAAPPRIPFLRIGWAAAAALVLAGLFILWPRGGNPDRMARVIEANGSLRWTGDGGEVRDGLARDLTLGGGTLESLSADSWVEIAFPDGSKVALSGQSSMTLSRNDGRGFIRLHKGDLSAEVAPQEAGRPRSR